jgi:hypothetical protein
MTDLIKHAKFSDAERYILDVVPHGNTSLSESGANLVKFRLPRQDILLGQDITFNFTAEADGDAGADDAFMSNIACIWESMSITVEGETVQHVRELGQLSCIDANLRWRDSYRGGWGAICQGVPAIASSGAALKYSMRLLHGNFLSNIIPTYKLGQIEVEFQLDQSVAKYTDATTAVTEVDVTLLTLKCPFVKSEELRSAYDSQDVVANFTDYDHHRDTSLLSGATSHTTVVPTSHKSVSGIIYTMRNQADVQDPNWGGEKYEACYLTNALTRLSFVVDGQQIPKREIRCEQQVELYTALVEYANHRKGSDYSAPDFFNGAYDTATDGQFLIAYPFNAFTGSEQTVSGLNTAQRTGQLEVHLTCTASANTQVDLWVRYDRMVKFLKDGGLSISK